MEIVWVPSAKVEFLFGKLGADAALAGANVQLRGEFHSSDKGRSLSVKGSPGQIVRAVNCLLFVLSDEERGHGDKTSRQYLEHWHYNDAKGAFRGPFKSGQLEKWYQQGYFDKEFLVKNSQTSCWVPIWVALQLGKTAQDNQETLDDVQMQDWESEVMSGLQHARQVASWPAGNVDCLVTDMMLDRLPDTPEKVALRAAMDIDTGLRQVMVVVDTNILLTHYATIQRLHDTCGTVTDNVEVVVVIPWIVLLELDDLKVSRGKKPSHIGQCARHALRKLMDAKSADDDFFRAQSKNDFIEASKIPLGVGEKVLHNDDRILQCCLHQDKYLQQKSSVTEPSCVVLLSNDNALCLKSRSAGIKSYRHNEMPLTPSAFVAACFAPGADTPRDAASSPQPSFSSSAQSSFSGTTVRLPSGVSIDPSTATQLASLAAVARAAQQNNHNPRSLNPLANSFQPVNPFQQVNRSNSFGNISQPPLVPTSEHMILKRIEQQLAAQQLRDQQQHQHMQSTMASQSSLPPAPREGPGLFRTSSHGTTHNQGLVVEAARFNPTLRTRSLTSQRSDVAAAMAARSISPSLAGSGDLLGRIDSNSLGRIDSNTLAGLGELNSGGGGAAAAAAVGGGGAAGGRNVDTLPHMLQGVMSGNGLTPAIQQALLDLLQTAADLPANASAPPSQAASQRNSMEAPARPSGEGTRVTEHGECGSVDLMLMDSHPPMSPSTPIPSITPNAEDDDGQPFEVLLEAGMEIIERALGPVLLYVMQQDQAEEWSYVISDKPPLSARGVINVLEHHWTGAFQDLFEDGTVRRAIPAKKDMLKNTIRKYEREGRVDGGGAQQALATLAVLLRVFESAKLPDMVYNGVQDNGMQENVVSKEEAATQLARGVSEADVLYSRCCNKMAAMGAAGL